MLLGVNFPPPTGFIWLTFVSFVLAISQYRYGNWLFVRIKDLKQLPLTIGLFSLEGLVSAIFFVTLSSKLNTYLWIWLAITVFVFACYGVGFWIFNRLIIANNEQKFRE